MSPEALTPGTNQVGRTRCTCTIRSAHRVVVGLSVSVGRQRRGRRAQVGHRRARYLVRPRVQDNVVYNANGAAFMFEDGQETSNDVVHNFAVRSFGTGGRDAGGRKAPASTSAGRSTACRQRRRQHLQRRPDASYGYKFFFVYLGTLRVPVKPGADTTVPGNYTEVDGNATAIAEFRNNEVYGSESGLTFWWLGTFGITPNLATPLSVFNNLRVWNVFGKGIFLYENYQVTIKDYVALNSRGQLRPGLSGDDYFAHSFRVEEPPGEGFAAGAESLLS